MKLSVIGCTRRIASERVRREEERKNNTYAWRRHVFHARSGLLYIAYRS